MRANPAILFAIGLTSAVLLSYQIAATRIISATATYHAAFGVIALVMLGLAASGTRVYIDRKNHPGERGRISRALVMGAGATVAGLVLILVAVALPVGEATRSVAAATALAAFYPPFYYAGYAIAAILTEWAEDVGRVYWADLVGAAIGAVAVVPLLFAVTPIQLGLVCATLLCAAAVLVSRTRDDGWQKRSKIALGVAVLLTVIGVAAPTTTELRRRAAHPEGALWTNWNHLTRVAVYKETPGGAESAANLKEVFGLDATVEELSDRAGIGWGMSLKYPGETPDIRYIVLDHDAGTPIIEGGADNPNIDILRWDVTALGYHAIEPDIDNVFVIGGGGGRDILTAKVFGAERVDAVELNPAVVGLVEEEMAEFSGKPYSVEGVNGTIGEARSELSRQDVSYDIIQMSMIDTWASSSSGAMVLTENVLYTREAFDIYRDKLSDDGVLSISRWFHPETYGELGRLLSMVGDSLQRGGIEDLEAHVVVAYTRGAHGGLASTTLMKKSSFTDEEIARVRKTADEMGFTVLWPLPAGEESKIAISELLRGEDPEGTTRFELEPATDDRPFFFNTYRPFGSYLAALDDGDWSQVSPATTVLLLILVIAGLASRMFVTGPLREAGEDPDEFPREAWIYFACLGLGFLCVELALLQRLILYLGHPTYALTIVLATVLLFGGIGSFLSSRIESREGTQRAGIAVVVCIAFVAFGLPALLAATIQLPLLARQAISVASIVPVGIALGLMYPSGISALVRSGRQSAVPWAWAINGIWGVMASIVGMIVAMTWGYTALLAVAAVAYVTASIIIRKFPDPK